MLEGTTSSPVHILIARRMPDAGIARLRFGGVNGKRPLRPNRDSFADARLGAELNSVRHWVPAQTGDPTYKTGVPEGAIGVAPSLLT